MHANARAIDGYKSAEGSSPCPDAAYISGKTAHDGRGHTDLFGFTILRLRFCRHADPAPAIYSSAAGIPFVISAVFPSILKPPFPAIAIRYFQTELFPNGAQRRRESAAYALNIALDGSSHEFRGCFSLQLFDS